MTRQPTWLDRLYVEQDPNMSKRSLFTNITPLPATITRETAVEQLHDHATMIELNPIVIRHVRTSPPPNAEPDEAESMLWYEITDEIQYLPGTRLKGEVSYKAGFYDRPDGLQTHVFAAGGVDIRAKWSVGGNAPGEQREPIELGVEKPKDGLYLREDVDLRCNVFLTNFVKRNLNKSHKTMVDDLLKKADLLQEKKSQRSGVPSGHSSRADSPYGDRTNISSPLNSSNSWPTSHTSHNPTPTPSKGPYREPGTSSGWQPASHPVSPQQQPADAYSPAYSWEQTPTSYSAPPAKRCTCTGGVHAKGCPFYPGLRNFPQQESHQFHSNVQHDPNPYGYPRQEKYSSQEIISGAGQEGRPWIDFQHNRNQRPPQNQRDQIMMELDGNPIAAQHYYQYQGKRAAELQ